MPAPSDSPFRLRHLSPWEKTYLPYAASICWRHSCVKFTFHKEHGIDSGSCAVERASVQLPLGISSLYEGEGIEVVLVSIWTMGWYAACLTFS